MAGAERHKACDAQRIERRPPNTRILPIGRTTKAHQEPRQPEEGQEGRDTAPPYDEIMRRIQMQEAAQAGVEGPCVPPAQMAAPPPSCDVPQPPYTPRRQVYHAEEEPQYEQRTTDPATRAPRQEPRTWARPAGGDRFKGRGEKGDAPAKVCALYRLKGAHVTYSHTLCHAVPSMPSLCMSAVVGERVPMTIIRQPAACRDDYEDRPISAGETQLITDTRTHPVPRADEREATGHHDELPGGFAVTEVHSPTTTLTVAHHSATDQAAQEHRPITADEIHLVTGIQCHPIPTGFAGGTRLPRLHDAGLVYAFSRSYVHGMAWP